MPPCPRRNAGRPRARVPCLSWSTCRQDTAGAVSTVAHHGDRLPFPVEVRPDIGAALATGPAHEAGLDVRQPDIVRPPVSARQSGCTGNPSNRSRYRARPTCPAIEPALFLTVSDASGLA